MIGYIQGEILHKSERGLIVLTGGLGYTLSVTTATAEPAKLGEKISLWTHLVVKEDALDLYGFSNQDQLRLFRLLISISGIGPKSALNVMSLADIATVTHAISAGNASYLTKVSGIGKKLAEKIVMELKDKLGDLASTEEAEASAESEALDALEALGYSPRDTREVVRTLAAENLGTHDIIRKALQILGGRT